MKRKTFSGWSSAPEVSPGDLEMADHEETRPPPEPLEAPAEEVVPAENEALPRAVPVHDALAMLASKIQALACHVTTGPETVGDVEGTLKLMLYGEEVVFSDAPTAAAPAEAAHAEEAQESVVPDEKAEWKSDKA